MIRKLWRIYTGKFTMKDTVDLNECFGEGHAPFIMKCDPYPVWEFIELGESLLG
jgi:hypothetical protein